MTDRGGARNPGDPQSLFGIGNCLTYPNFSPRPDLLGSIETGRGFALFNRDRDQEAVRCTVPHHSADGLSVFRWLRVGDVQFNLTRIDLPHPSSAFSPPSSSPAEIANDRSLDPRFTVGQRREPGLDLLRAVAIVLVVFYHAGIFGFRLPWDLQRFGWVGVDLFFVLSGYLIGGQLFARWQSRGEIGFGRFYARRALRILPAYLCVLAIYYFVPSGREYPVLAPAWKFLVSVQNFGLRGGTAFSHAWSLAVEDQFYLLLPLLLLLVNRSARTSMILPGLILLGGLALRGFLAWQFPSPAGGVSFRAYQFWIYYPTWTRLDPLVLGVVLAAIRRYRRLWWETLLDKAPWLLPLGLASIVYGLYLGEGELLTIAACVWQFPLIAFGMALLLICGVSPRLAFARLRIPGSAFLASIAYSTYLSHKLIIHFVLQLCAKYSLALTSAWATLLLHFFIYATGALLFFAVERPFLQLRNRVAK